VEIEVKSRDMEVSDRLYEYVSEKTAKLDRYINGIIDAHVDLAFVKSARDANDRHVAQITLRGKGFELRAEERTDEIFSAFDLALDKIQRRIERYKGKHYRGRGDGTSVAEAAMEILESQSQGQEEEPVIKRRKKFLLTPMDELEAIEQMNLLGHEDFFVFFNVETNSVNVLYMRRDGSYGLIDTELG
jgi:putative sigma-54 modulation protein